jgi:hypothetical protein
VQKLTDIISCILSQTSLDELDMEYEAAVYPQLPTIFDGRDKEQFAAFDSFMQTPKVIDIARRRLCVSYNLDGPGDRREDTSGLDADVIQLLPQLYSSGILCFRNTSRSWGDGKLHPIRCRSGILGNESLER